MNIALPWPDKLLWPNGPRSNRHAVSRVKKAARNAASWAAIEVRQRHGLPDFGEGEIAVRIKVYPKPRGPMPDKDNCVAALKVQLDAIAEQVGVNDRRFAAPVVEFCEPRDGHIEVELSSQCGQIALVNLCGADSDAVEQKQAEQCSSTARPTPETLSRSATDAA